MKYNILSLEFFVVCVRFFALPLCFISKTRSQLPHLEH
ncbi:unnamed protein product [Brassica rapa subsp. trilocularis]